MSEKTKLQFFFFYYLFFFVYVSESSVGLTSIYEFVFGDSVNNIREFWMLKNEMS